MGAGRPASVRATRLVEGLVIDGHLDEPIYERVPAMGAFIQQEPREGEPATEATDAWIFFDDRNLYVSARLWDSAPERIIATEMRRDNWNVGRGASFTVALDTFHDRRNGFIFQTNPLGALRDAQVTDERNENDDWNTVWHTKSARFAHGWTVEMAIPFKSLRYQQGADQVWGVNLQRNVRWKNERSFLSPVPAAFTFGGINRFSYAATLLGIQAPASSKNLEFKPYAISTVSTDRRATPVVSNDAAGDLGFDVKYGLTRGLTTDFTVNTDFAQVEADEEQVNLTRFSLFFPEKREFFLEGQGIFTFGGRQASAWGPGGDTPIMFYSRRIGIDDGQIVPLRAGARMTGRVGKYTVGLLNIQTGESESALAPSTNFSVVRLRRDILRRSTVGIIGAHRSVSLDGLGSNQVFGADANFAFYQNLAVDAYYAESRTPGRSGANTSYRGRIANQGDRYGFEYEHLVVGENFNPEIGFLRRRDFRLNHVGLDFTPRPNFTDAVRKFSTGSTLTGSPTVTVCWRRARSRDDSASSSRPVTTGTSSTPIPTSFSIGRSGSPPTSRCRLARTSSRTFGRRISSASSARSPAGWSSGTGASTMAPAPRLATAGEWSCRPGSRSSRAWRSTGWICRSAASRARCWGRA